jgi:ABC transporter substrate binding protein
MTTGALVPIALLSAQQRSGVSEVPRIGYIGLRPLTESAASMESITALREGLRDLGRVEGKDYLLEVRVADNDPARYPELAAELSKLQVKLIVAASTPAAVAIHKANPTMPLVLRGPDIVGAGLADSASRPGGVTTGIDELRDPQGREARGAPSDYLGPALFDAQCKNSCDSQYHDTSNNSFTSRRAEIASLLPTAQPPVRVPGRGGNSIRP